MGVARVAVKIGVVAAEIAVPEHLSKDEAHHQEQKPDGSNAQKDGECREPCNQKHADQPPPTEGSLHPRGVSMCDEISLKVLLL